MENEQNTKRSSLPPAGSVRSLLGRFEKKASPLSPAQYEEQRKKTELQEKEAIKLARERAARYNLMIQTKQREVSLSIAQSRKSSNNNNNNNNNNNSTNAAAAGVGNYNNNQRVTSVRSKLTSVSQQQPSSLKEQVISMDGVGVGVDTGQKVLTPEKKTVGLQDEQVTDHEDEDNDDVGVDDIDAHSNQHVDDEPVAPLPTSLQVADRLENSDDTVNDADDEQEDTDEDKLKRVSERSTSSMTTVATPIGGYQEIHNAVYTNRLSTSDRLLNPSKEPDYNYDEYGRGRKLSVSSVGPTLPDAQKYVDVCRLNTGITVRDVLVHFYQVYDPEKLKEVDVVLKHFKNRSEALLYTLECKYFVNIAKDGTITPFRRAAPGDELIEDEVKVARKASGTESVYTDFTTNSYKGYDPNEMKRSVPEKPPLGKGSASTNRLFSSHFGRSILKAAPKKGIFQWSS